LKEGFDMNRRGLLELCVAGLLLPGGTRHAWAQADRPITLVVPYAPGGTSDMLGRLLGQHMGPMLKRSVIVENRPGAGTTLGAVHVSRSAPDGTTLLLATSTTLSINPSLHKKLPYDSVKDFAPVGLVGSVPLMVVVNPTVKANTLAELVALAKAAGQPLAYGSAGNGSPQHLAAEMFKAATGTELNHVPYKGSGPALTDLLGGQLQLMFTDIAPALQHVRSGKLRALAVTSRQRQAVLPDVPTVLESQVPGTASFEAVAWQCIVAPAGTPSALVDQYSKVLQAVLALPDIRKRLESDGVEPAHSTPDELAAFIKSESQRWGRVVKSANVSLD